MYRALDDHRAAARMATLLGTDRVDFCGELAVVQGWLARAASADELDPRVEHGWLWVHEAEKHLLMGETTRTRELGAQAAQLG